MANRIPLGPFELIEPIGKGGMGEVWSGIHVPQNIPVAVKVLKAEGTKREEYVEAFHNEVRAVAALDHPAIIMPLDYGSVPTGTQVASNNRIEAGSPFIVMEHAKRGSLKRFQQVIGWRETKMVLFTILDALAHAHAAGVIHRDMKPANILVGVSDETPGIKLTDFGLARASDSFERPGTVETGWGTPNYMAPEQFRGRWRDYGPWTDLYALGVMAYELTSGRQPFHADSQVGFARAHALLPPAKYESAFPVPEGFQSWVMRLLQKEPADRFQRAADAAWGLQLLGDPAPTSGRRTVNILGAGDPDDAATAAPSVVNTARQPPSAPDPDPTVMDRPDTTELLGFDDLKMSTAALSVADWDMNSDEAIEFALGDLAQRMIPPLPFTWKRPTEAKPSLKLLGAGLGLFGLRAVRMVGREAERDVIWKHLRATRQSGKPHGVVLRGTSGTGKTRLAKWIARRGHEVGSAVTFVATHSPTGGPSDGLARMMARQMRCVGLTREETYERLKHYLPNFGMKAELDWLAFTELLSPQNGLSGGASSEISLRFGKTDQRFALIRRYLAALAETRPVVLLLDDVQWGSETLAFVMYMLDRQTSGPAALFMMTVREEALAERPVEGAMLDHVTRAEVVQTQLIGSLDDDDTQELVRELLYLHEGLAEEIEQRCGGNPLFAWQLVNDLVDQRKLQFGAGGFELGPAESLEIPDNIHEVWLRRLKSISQFFEPGILESIEIAATMGGDVDLLEWSIACRSQGLHPPKDIVVRLIDAGLASPTEVGWAFCHGLLRESLERHAAENNRNVQHHEACIDMLTARYPDASFPHSERFATHLIAAGRQFDALRHLDRSFRGRLALSDFEVATRHAQTLETLGTQLNDQKVCVDSWLKVAQLKVEQGDLDEALRLSEKAAIEARKHGWRDMIPKSLFLEGQAQLAHGQLLEARRTFEKASEAFDKQNQLDGVAECTLGLARVHQFHGDFDAAVGALAQAQTLFDQGQNDLGKAKTLNALGDVERARNEHSKSRSSTISAMELFRSLGNQMGVADCINDLAELSRMQGDLEGALNSCQEAISIYRSLGSDQEMFARQNLGLILLQYSRYRESRDVFETNRLHFQHTRQWGLLAATNVFLLPSLAILGEWETWEDRVEEAQTMLNRTGYWDAEIGKALEMAAKSAEKANKHPLALRARALKMERVPE